MARKQKFNYFKAFIQISDCAVEYAEALVKYMEKNAQIASEGREPDIEHAIERWKELHKIEDKSDELRAGVSEALSTEFLAPIEREDIMLLAERLDDLVDDLDEVLQRMYMFDVHIVQATVIEMMRYAYKCTIAVNDLCKELHNFKKPSSLKKYIKAVHKTEKEADMVYIKAMHDDFAHAKAVGATSLDAMGQAQMLSALEDVCDLCQSIASAITIIVMKNS